MRILLVSAALLLAVPAQAQDQRPTTGQRIVLVGGAAVGGLAVGLVGPFVPVTVAAATYGTSAALGLDPSLRGVVLDTALGTAVGAAAGTATFVYWTEVEGYDADLGTSLGSFFVTVAAGSVATGSVATGLIHGARVRVPAGVTLAPAALAAPTGERTTGLSLRLSL